MICIHCLVITRTNHSKYRVVTPGWEKARGIRSFCMFWENLEEPVYPDKLNSEFSAWEEKIFRKITGNNILFESKPWNYERFFMDLMIFWRIFRNKSIWIISWKFQWKSSIYFWKVFHMKRFPNALKNDSGIPGNYLNISWPEPVLGNFKEIPLCRWQAWPGQGRVGHRHSRIPLIWPQLAVTVFFCTSDFLFNQ